MGGGRQSFFSFPLSFEQHRGWLDERGLADEGLLQREAERLTTTIEGAVEPEDRLCVVHSRQLARANELLMQRISAAFRQVPCPADGERLGLTCWKRPRL